MKTITVKGVGNASVKPDLIVISMRLETEDKEYTTTTLAAAQRIDALNKSLEEIGFGKDALKTTDFSVRTVYESVREQGGNYKSVFKGYACSHTLKVEFGFDAKRLASILSAISRCVAKPELTVTFTVKDPSAVSSELLHAAAQNANEKANVLCSAAGVKLGELLSIDYNFGDINVCSDTDYKVEGRCMMKAEACLSDINIVPDDIKVNDTVTFVWEIERKY